MSEEKKRTSLSMDQRLFDMMDEIIEETERYQYWNEVIADAIELLYDEDEDIESGLDIKESLCKDSVLLLRYTSEERDMVEYLTVEDGELVKKSKDIS